MLPQIVKTILLLLAILAVTTHSNASEKTANKLLKFHPISQREYASLQHLVKHKKLPLGKRSISDLSDSLPSIWNQIFNVDQFLGDTDGEDVKGYPICVLKANETVKGIKRRGRQYYFNQDGTQPTVVYTAPTYSGYHPEYAPYGEPVYAAPNEELKPIINCVVVLRRNPELTTPKPKTQGIPVYPYAPSSVYKLPIAAPPGYPVYQNYPKYPSFEEYTELATANPIVSTRKEVKAKDSNNMDPSQVLYQVMVNQYVNQQLAKLYMAQTVAQVARNWNEMAQQDDDDDEEEGEQKEAVEFLEYPEDDHQMDEEYQEEVDDEDRDDEDAEMEDENEKNHSKRVRIEYDENKD